MSTMADDEKLTALQQDVQRLNGEVKELRAKQAALEARLISLSETIEDRQQH